ncbi:MAG: sensor histidine kinase [Acidimicrobiales bacterium]
MSSAPPDPVSAVVTPASSPVSYRWVRPLAVVVIGTVVTTAFQTHPGPGAHGRHLGVTLALIGIAAGIAGAIRLRGTAPTVLMMTLVVVAVSSAALVALQPAGPGFVGVFPAVSAAALRLSVRSSAAVAGVAVVALAIGWAVGGHRPVAEIFLNELGVVSFYLVSMFARRFRESNDRAHQLIVELETTRAAQAQAAALGERQRLAREMHDVLAHSLSGLVLNLEGARLLARQGGADASVGDAIERAHRLARSGLEEARRAIGMLRDDALPGPERLAGLAMEFEGDTGVACVFALSGDERDVGSDGRLTVYRVAQEALTNIRKHARPERVEVHLAYEAAGMRLTVEDFGTGGDRSPPVDGTGYGLTGMRERAELLGGRLSAGPTELGFRVELWVPA